jgi:hypothetical protein
MTDVKISASTEQKPANNPPPATPQQTQTNPPKTDNKPSEQQK